MNKLKNIITQLFKFNRRKAAWLIISGVVFASMAVNGFQDFRSPNKNIAEGLSFNDPLSPDRFQEKTIEGDGENKIVVLHAEGVLLDAPGEDFLSSGIVPIDTFAKQIDQARNDASVKAIIIVINSPGGSVTASQTIHEKIVEARNAGKVVIAQMREVAASGGYYIAAPANKIVANPSTITGSIGVIMQLANLEDLYKKIGYKPIVFKSGKFKDIGNDGRPMTEEEREIIQTLLDEEYNRFIDVVARGRNIDRVAAAKLAEGRIYSGSQAQSAGLVDELGNFDKAVEIAKSQAKIDHARVIEYVSPLSFVSDLFGSFLGPTSADSLIDRIDNITNPYPQGLLYLWQP